MVLPMYINLTELPVISGADNNTSGKIQGTKPYCKYLELSPVLFSLYDSLYTRIWFSPCIATHNVSAILEFHHHGNSADIFMVKRDRPSVLIEHN